MAISYLTYEDWAKDTRNGKTPLHSLVREFDINTTLASALPLRVATEKFEDHGGFVEPWKPNRASRTAAADDPFIPSKVSTYDRIDIMGRRNGGQAIQMPDRDMTGAEFDQYCLDQLHVKLNDMALDVELSMIFGNPDVDPRDCLGLYPRFNKITDRHGIVQAGDYKGYMAPYVTIDAGGGDSNDGALTSAWLLFPSAERGVTRLITPGTEYTGSVRYIPPNGWETYSKTDQRDGAEGWQYEQKAGFDIIYGIAILNRRACIRIANIDTTTEAGLKSFLSAYRQANAAMDKAVGKTSRLMYGGEDLQIALGEYWDSLKYPTSYNAARPEGIGTDVYIGNQRLDVCPHIECNEAYVA